eukprot:jgi/Tetstr1/431851/TSEL_021342.t1
MRMRWATRTSEARVTYRFKAKKALTGEEQVAEHLIYSRVFDPAEHEHSANIIDGMLAALEEKRLEVGLAVAAKDHAVAQFKKKERDEDPTPPLHGRSRTRRRERSVNMSAPGSNFVPHHDVIQAHLKFLFSELRRFTKTGTWEQSMCAWWVSRAFFVPKPGDN